jgi:hypothetical protein
MPKPYVLRKVNLLLSIIAVFVLYGCSIFNKQRCIQNEMIGHTFRYFSEDQPRGHFIMNDSIYSEFVDGRLYAKSKIVWLDCEEYFLIPQEITYNKGVKVGDTLQVRILSLKHDTLTCLASAYGQSHEFKVIRSK